MFDDAIKDAEELDRYFVRHGTTIGPLHGVPVTLKDQFNVKGFDSTIGYVGRAYQPAQDDCALVKLLHSLGAVVIAKTNLPQSIMVRSPNPPPACLTHELSPRFYSGAKPTTPFGVRPQTP